MAPTQTNGDSSDNGANGDTIDPLAKMMMKHRSYNGVTGENGVDCDNDANGDNSIHGDNGGRCQWMESNRRFLNQW